MFIGQYYHQLESKGRVSLPKKFREKQVNWVVTRGLDGGLFVFRENDFADKIKELAARSLTKKKHRDFARLMANQASELKVDKNGRVSLPDYLITFANLKKELVIVGSYSYLEIWDRDLYHSYLNKLEKEAEAIAEGMEN